MADAATALLPPRRFLVTRMFSRDTAILNVSLRTYDDFVRWVNRTFHAFFGTPEYGIFAMRRPKEPEPVSDTDPFDEPLAVFLQPAGRPGVFAAGFKLQPI
jgi:hypothetical protein